MLLHTTINVYCILLYIMMLLCLSGQVVILKARPAMDAAVMSFHLSLSPTSSSSLTRFRPVVMPYNDKLALFKSFSILSIHRCFGRPTGRFPVGFQLWTMDGHLPLFILEICPYHFILLFRTVFSAIACPVLTRTSTLLTLSVYLMRSIRRNHRFSHAFSLS